MKTKHFYQVAWMMVAIISWMSFTTKDDEKVIKVDKISHDFETISEEGGPVSATFVLTNNTDEAIAITNVRASCGCTVPTWTKTPIEKGKKGTITVTFDPKNRTGAFDKTITILTTGTPERIIVTIKGIVKAAE